MKNLSFTPALERPELLAKPVEAVLREWSGTTPVNEIHVAEIDPGNADTAAFNEAYDTTPEESANCVVLRARGGGNEWYVACMVLASTRADVNHFIKKHIGASKVSFASMDDAVALTAMEYGGITPFGVPSDWRILIDSAVMKQDRVIVGSGIRGSKMTTPSAALAELPNAEVADGAATLIA